jgi:hypothetical protein
MLLVDLDNALIDRAAAFDRWAREFGPGRAEPVCASGG